MFIYLFVVIAAWSWVGLTLAAVGWFRLPLVASLSLAVTAIAAVAVRRGAAQAKRATRRPWTETSAVLAWAALAAVLFTPPGEYAIDGGDGSIYLNTGAALARTGMLNFPEPLLELTAVEDRVHVFKPVRGALPVFDLFPGGMQIPQQGGAVQPNFFHLYPVWIALADLTAGPLAGYHVSWLFALLGVLALWTLGRELSSVTTANVAAGLLCVNFAQVWFARSASSETIAQYLVLCGLVFVVRALRMPSLATSACAGIAFGLAACARIDILLLVSPIVAAVLGLVALRRRWTRVSTAMAVPFAALTVQAILHGFLVSGPYTLRILRLMFAGRAVSLWALALPPILLGVGIWLWLVAVGRLPRPPRWVTFIISVAIGSLAMFRLGPELITGYLPMLITPVGCLLAVVGVVWLLRERVSEDVLLTVGILLASALVYAESVRDRPEIPQLLRRFVPVILPLSLLFAGHAVARTADAAGRWRAVILALPLLFGMWCWRDLQPVLASSPMQGIHAQLAAASHQLPPGAVLITDATTPSHFGLSLRYLFNRDVIFAQPGSEAAAVIAGWGLTLEQQERPLFAAVGRDARAHGVPTLDARALEGLTLSPSGVVALDLRQLISTTDRLPDAVQQIRPVIELYRARPAAGAGLHVDVDIGEHDIGWRESGFHGYERMGESSARWTFGRAVIRLPKLGATVPADALVMRLAAPRPAGIAPPSVVAALDGERIGETPALDSSFREVRIPLSAAAAARLRVGRSQLELTVPTFVPAATGGSADQRQLGVVVDWVRIVGG